MSYDHWKTTDPADEQLGSTMGSRMIPRSTRLQCAADDAYQIGEAIEALGNLLDRFREQHGLDLSVDLAKNLPWKADIEDATAERVYAFARSLEPVEDRP